MRFGILGPFDIRTEEGGPPGPGRPPPRALLTLLLLVARRTVSTERSTDGLYGVEPPAGAANALRSQVSRGDHADAAATLSEALALWRGPALSDLPDAHAQATRLHELLTDTPRTRSAHRRPLRKPIRARTISATRPP